MGIFDIFKRYKVVAEGKCREQMPSTSTPIQYSKALQFNGEFAALLGQDKYIARSDYKHFIDTYQDIYQFFVSVAEAHILDEFANKSGLDLVQIRSFLDNYGQIQDLTREAEVVRKHNSQYVVNHIYSTQDY